MSPSGLMTGLLGSCRPPKELHPSNPPDSRTLTVSVEYVPAMGGCPSIDSRIQVAPPIDGLVGLGSGTTVAIAVSGRVAGCGPLQAMPTVSITVMARTTISPVVCMGLDLPT